MVTDQDTGLLPRCRERRVFLFEQIVIFSEPLDKKKGFSTPGFLFKNSIKVRCRASSPARTCPSLDGVAPSVAGSVLHLL